MCNMPIRADDSYPSAQVRLGTGWTCPVPVQIGGGAYNIPDLQQSVPFIRKELINVNRDRLNQQENDQEANCD